MKMSLITKGAEMADYVSLQIRVTKEDKEMIKADAKALGMTPGKYISMVCKLVNESARELAAGQFVESMTKSMLRGLEGK